jgi:hypothetical protein
MKALLMAVAMLALVVFAAHATTGARLAFAPAPSLAGG